jgi:hypothetical protein
MLPSVTVADQGKGFGNAGGARRGHGARLRRVVMLSRHYCEGGLPEGLSFDDEAPDSEPGDGEDPFGPARYVFVTVSTRGP